MTEHFGNSRASSDADFEPATGYVIDASIAVEYLLKTPRGLKVADLIDSATLVAPEMMDAEVLSVLRRAVLTQRIEESMALTVLSELSEWAVERISHRHLARLAWRHRHNVSAYDALYVAVARVYELPLLTADGRLAHAPELGITVLNVPAA